MSGPPNAVETLIDLMAKLPGLGPRSARRAVLHLLRKRSQLLVPLSKAMAEAASSVHACKLCGNFATEDLCPICTDDRRATGVLCVVEDVADLWALERAGVFKGRYQVLGGTLSALDAIGPEELGIPGLARRVGEEEISEVILALNATVDGQTTAHYIADVLGDRVKVTSLAQGVPVGGELDYLDDGTLGAALRSRRAF